MIRAVGVRRVAALASVLVASASGGAGGECRPPGSLVSTEELQFGAGAVYNPHRDEFLVTYADGPARAVRLRPDGTIAGQAVLSIDPRPDKRVYEAQAAYDPDRREYLAVWRRAAPNEIFARYLDDEARPIGPDRGIVLAPDQGNEVSVVYAPAHDRYLVLWTNWRTKTVHYRMVAGGSGSAQPLLGDARVVEQGAVSGVVAYGETSDQFLVAFTKDFAPEPRRADVYARFVDGAGESVGPLVALSTGPHDQQRPRIGYAPAHDRWLVVFEDWRAQATNVADVNGVFIDGAGVVSTRFPVAATAGVPDVAWDAPGEVAFNAASDRFLVAWYRAEVTYAREVDPVRGELGPVVTVCADGNPSPSAAAARPVAGDPQFLVTWRNGYRGLHAALVASPARSLDAGVPEGGRVDGGRVDAGAVDAGGVDAGASLDDAGPRPDDAGLGAGGDDPPPAPPGGCESHAGRVAPAWIVMIATVMMRRRRPPRARRS